MARKERSFAAKLAHAGKKHVVLCSVCNKEKVGHMIIRSMKSERTGGWRFREQHVKICGCNREEFGV